MGEEETVGVRLGGGEGEVYRACRGGEVGYGGRGVAVLVCDIVWEDDAQGGGEDVFWVVGLGILDTDLVCYHFGVVEGGRGEGGSWGCGIWYLEGAVVGGGLLYYSVILKDMMPFAVISGGVNFELPLVTACLPHYLNGKVVGYVIHSTRDFNLQALLSLSIYLKLINPLNVKEY